MKKTVALSLSQIICLLLISSCTNEDKDNKPAIAFQDPCDLALSIEESKQDIKDSMLNSPKEGDITTIPLDQIKFFLVDSKKHLKEFVLNKTAENEWKIIKSKNASEQSPIAIAESVKQNRQSSPHGCLKLMKDTQGNYHGWVSFSSLSGSSGIDKTGPKTKAEIELFLKNHSYEELFSSIKSVKHLDDKGNFIIE
jgi:hypothetical protein